MSRDLFITVVVGPTGAGKTDFSVAWARYFGGEVISADSCQVYRGMDIGTGKVSADIRKQIPHHLIDILEPDEQMTVAKFVESADEIIEDNAARQSPVIVAGGTAMYVNALLLGLFDGPTGDKELRLRLQEEAAREGVSALWERLYDVDPVAAEKIEMSDERRIVRALEVYILTGTPISEHHSKKVPRRYRAKIIGLMPARDALYERINQRVLQMLDEGLEEEVRSLREKGYGTKLSSQQAIGYAEFHRYLDGELEKEEAIRLIQRNSRRYARRQLTWYRSWQDIVWYSSAEDVPMDETLGWVF